MLNQRDTFHFVGSCWRQKLQRTRNRNSHSTHLAEATHVPQNSRALSLAGQIPTKMLKIRKIPNYTAIEIVDFPMKMVIFHCYVSSPEGINFREAPKDHQLKSQFFDIAAFGHDLRKEIITTYGTTRLFLDLRVTKPCRTCSQGGVCSTM